MDKFIIGKFDKWLEKAQHQGYSLWSIRTFFVDIAVGLMMGSWVLQGSFSRDTPMLILFAICSLAYIGISVYEHHIARKYADYMKSPNMANELNVLVLIERFVGLWNRCFVWAFFIFNFLDFVKIYYHQAKGSELVWDAGWALWLVYLYTKTAIFVGPNAFAKDYVPKGKLVTY